MGSQTIEGITQVSFMLNLCTAENEYIIKIYSDELVEYRAKDMVHQPLKGTRRVHQAEGKYTELKQPETRQKSGLTLITRGNGNLVVAALQV